MSILIGKYEFDGPYYSVSKLEEKPGLYAVLHYEGEEYQLIQLSQAENVRESIEIASTDHASGSTLLAACYVEGSRTKERISMVEETLIEFDDEDNGIYKREQLSKPAS